MNRSHVETSDSDTASLTLDDTLSDTNPGMITDNETDTVDPPSHQPQHLQRFATPDLAQLLINSLQYMTSPDMIPPPELTEEEYRGKHKAWDESTSTSPTSNMHLGHLQAYWADHTLADGSQDSSNLEETRKRILKGHLLVLNYAIQFGYSFDKWKCIINTMLEKDHGLPKIHRLRVIHLYEGNYNSILGVNWRQVLHHAISKGLIKEGCYGSQPGKEATNALFIHEMEYEISRLTQKASLHLDNDSTSCYD